MNDFEILNAGVLTFKEFARREPLPLATIHDAVLEFLRGRDDVVVFGATAVNAYVDEPRMTQDIDLMSVRAAAIAEELRQLLSDRFHIAIRVRVVSGGEGYRLSQVLKTGSRQLVDVRRVETLPDAERIDDILVLSPLELIAAKVIAFHSRRGRPKAGTDWRDLAMLLLAFPEFKSDPGVVLDLLRASGASDDVIGTWEEIAVQEIIAPTDDDEFE